MRFEEELAKAQQVQQVVGIAEECPVQRTHQGMIIPRVDAHPESLDWKAGFGTMMQGGAFSEALTTVCAPSFVEALGFRPTQPSSVRFPDEFIWQSPWQLQQCMVTFR